MASHDDGPRSMDNIRVGDSSIANQGNIDVLHHSHIRFQTAQSANQKNYQANNQTNTHNYYGTPPPATPVQAYVRAGLPPRNPNRVERKGLLEKLEKMLPRGEEHEPVALWGLLGSGKTQVALQYAHQRLSQKNCSIFWVHAKDKATLVNDFRAISRKAVLCSRTDGREMLQAVREWIESQPTWVMIIDGADDVELFTRSSGRRGQLREFIPDGPNGTLIWTSRDRRILEVVGWTRGVRVGSMTPDEAVSLLHIRANQGGPFENSEATRQLVQELGHNPFIISHVATAMRAHFTPEEMLTRLSDPCQRGDILETPRIDSDKPQDGPRSVFDILASQVELLASQDPEAYCIIASIAYLDCHAIPLDIFFDENKQGGDVPVRRAISRLKDLSLLINNPADEEGFKCDADGLTLEAIRRHLDQRAIPDPVSKVGGGQRDKANLSSPRNYRVQATTALLRRFPRTIYYDTLELCKSLVEHALKVSHWEPSQHDELIETSDLLTRVGDYLLFCGRWCEMEAPYQRALEFRRKALRADDIRTIAAMDSLAHAQMKLGYYRPALELFTEAFKLRTDGLGLSETHPDVMANNMNIGVAHRILGQLFFAETLITKALALRIETFGDDHPDSAQSMYEMALLYRSQQSDAQSFRDRQTELLTKSLRIQKRHLGDEHPKTMKTKLQLGCHLDLMGDTIEGRRLHEEVFELQQRLLGRLHPFALETKRSMSVTRYSNIDRKQAFQSLSEVAADSEATLGRSNPVTLRALDDLAQKLSIREDFAAAADIQRDILDAYSHQLGETHTMTLRVQLDLASSYLSQRREEDCKTLATTAYDALALKYGKGAALNRAVELMHPNTKVVTHGVLHPVVQLSSAAVIPIGDPVASLLIQGIYSMVAFYVSTEGKGTS